MVHPNTTSKNNILLIAFIVITINILLTIHIKAKAQTLEYIPYNEVTSGQLFFKDENGYHPNIAHQSHYRLSINGLIARISLSQTFKNNSENWVEAVYVFPLAENAAVDGMIMEIGERKIIGQIKEKQQAKKLYNHAKRLGKKASLVSQQRPNMFTTKVANIAPHQEVKIHLSYIQTIWYKKTFHCRETRKCGSAASQFFLTGFSDCA